MCVCARVYLVNLLWTCCLPVTGDHHQPQCRREEEEELRCMDTALWRRRRRDALGKRLLRPPEPRGSAEDGYGELYFPHLVDLRILILSYRLKFHGFRGRSVCLAYLSHPFLYVSTHLLEASSSECFPMFDLTLFCYFFNSLYRWSLLKIDLVKITGCMAVFTQNIVSLGNLTSLCGSCGEFIK